MQVPPTSVKGVGSSVFEGRSGYGSTMQDSPKYTSENYPAANQKYVSKGEKMFSDDRLPYAERSSAYSGRDLQTESTVRLADSLAFGHQHQVFVYTFMLIFLSYYLYRISPMAIDTWYIYLISDGHLWSFGCGISSKERIARWEF